MALTETLYPSADAEIQLENPSLKLGTQSYFWVGWEFGGGEVHSDSLFRFDLSSISHASTVISSASLRLYAYGQAANADLWLHMSRITSNWTESTVNYSARPSYFSGTDFSGRVVISHTDIPKTYNISLNSSHVQNWARGDWTNYGLYLWRESHNDHGKIGFRSREWETTSQRPLLTITYYYAPDVTTSAASAIGTARATLAGNITSVNGSNCTARGFQYGLSQTPTWTVNQSGSYGTGAYSLNVTGLYSGRTYYFRAYATNPAGTSYGSWNSFRVPVLSAGVI